MVQRKKPGSDRLNRFIAEYMVHLNATKAYITVFGDSSSIPSAQTKASSYLRKPHVREAMELAMKERAQRMMITQDRVLVELARLAFSDITDLIQWDEQMACYIPSRDLSPDQRAAIQSIETKTDTYSFGGEVHTTTTLKIKTYDKGAALDKLMRHLGAYLDRVQVGGDPANPLVIEDETSVRVRLAERVAGLANRMLQGGRDVSQLTSGNGNGNGNGGH